MFSLNPTKLAELQDQIIFKLGITSEEAKSLSQQLSEYAPLVDTSFFGFNDVSQNNLAIRYNFIQAALNKIFGNIVKSNAHFNKAFNLLTSYIVNGFYVEGYSYFLYVKNSYAFLLQYMPDKNLPVFNNVETNYQKLAAPDERIPTTDTHFEDISGDVLTDALYTGNYYSVHRRPNAYVFVNHFDKLNSFSHNLHINYEFGHFCIYSGNSWKCLYPCYPGYGVKSTSPIKNSWNNNIIVNGLRTAEPYWRYLPFKPKLSHKYFKSFSSENLDNHQFEIGEITRTISIGDHMVTVADSGGSYSSFNISNDCQLSVLQATKVVNDVGFHAVGAQVVEHKRVKVYGKERKIDILF